MDMIPPIQRTVLKQNVMRVEKNSNKICQSKKKGGENKHLRIFAACGLLALLEQAMGEKKQSMTHQTAGRKNHPRMNTFKMTKK